MSYQWRKDGNDISGATMSTYTIYNAKAADQGAYSVYIVNGGGSALSPDANLTVLTPPSITTQPQSKMVAATQTASFSVVATGTPTLTYRWRLNGVQLASATSSTLTITNVQAVNAGNYTVVVGNYYGSVTSSVATLSLGTIPSITTQPKTDYMVTNDQGSFTVVASGTGTLHYQWWFAGAPLAGATKSTLSIIAQPSTAGAYNVVVTNNLGSVTSTVAYLILGSSAHVATRPQGQTVAQGQDVLFTVGASGTAPIYYQWTFKGNALLGATSSTLALTNVQPADAGNYRVTVTNSWGSDTSNPATLVVNTPPVITTQPQSQVVAAGQTASLSVAVTGMSPLSYQWNFQGNPLAGATAGTLSLTNAQLANAGNYFVVITNALGSATSVVVSLAVTSPITQTPTLTTGAMTSTGFSFQLSVPTGSTYVILASTDLLNWVPISTNVANSASATFNDPDATNFPKRFYRAMLLP